MSGYKRNINRITYRAILALSASQSQRSVGVLPHMSYCRIWREKMVLLVHQAASPRAETALNISDIDSLPC